MADKWQNMPPLEGCAPLHHRACNLHTARNSSVTIVGEIRFLEIHEFIIRKRGRVTFARKGRKRGESEGA